MRDAPPPPQDGAEESLLPISALQHFLFCPRQCALIHIERLWAENSATAEGRLLHDKVDSARDDSRGGIRTLRSLALRSFALGIAGVADAVEKDGAKLFPIEFKRGRPKKHRADEVQLCAQALCLEEMFGIAVPRGALYYGATRRRREVAFDDELRRLTIGIAREATVMVRSQKTPPPAYSPGLCGQCSLIDLCRPKQLTNPPHVAAWLVKMVGD
jgi:CRISPR-associated exonuclease Cas4